MNSSSITTEKRCLIMSAVESEREAILRGLNGDPRFDVVLAGVGPIAAAIQTIKALSKNAYNLVVSAGIGGAFPGKADIGSIVLSNEIIAADLGVETLEGFRSLDEMGFGLTKLQVDTNKVMSLIEALKKSDLSVFSGPVLTVSTASGTSNTLKERSIRISDAMAEAMEGFGVALAAEDQGVPMLELRAISNIVGPRNRDLWRIQEALESLEKASFYLSEVF